MVEQAGARSLPSWRDSRSERMLRLIALARCRPGRRALATALYPLLPPPAHASLASGRQPICQGRPWHAHQPAGSRKGESRAQRASLATCGRRATSSCACAQDPSEDGSLFDKDLEIALSALTASAPSQASLAAAPARPCALPTESGAWAPA